MHLLQGKQVDEEVDVFYTPAYAAGDVVADSLISNVLLSQTYYKPDIVQVIKALSGMPPTITAEAHVRREKVESTWPSNTDQPVSSRLTSIPVPDLFIGQTFSRLFESLLLDQGVLALGLLRSPDKITFGNELPFVYSNPVPSLILRASDFIYILAQPGWVL
ncbi:hypothetical protein BJV82DRAFT_619876 [Fennellomyces sp. T-0311]|nr:hypothetical protein BJV82DRAFT_619876 [Fennellomyces sp. T-0311]